MIKIRVYVCILTVVLMYPNLCQGQVMVKRYATLMGSRFDFSIVAEDSLVAHGYIDRAIQEVKRIENLISEWRPETQISEVNRNAGIRPVKVEKEVFDLTKRAIGYSAMTHGAFDISIAAMDKIWQYDGSMTEMPSPEAIARSVGNVGYKYIMLDSINSTIYLTRKGMKIGFGSIGKGYAADQCRALLRAGGAKGGIVNASGDLSAWDEQANGKPWKIGINNPFRPGKMLKVLKLKTASVTTSGSYEKYAEINGKRYSHIINPKTGYPSTGLTSVTVIGPNAEFANALSTSMMVMGTEAGIELAKRFPNYRYVLISDSGKVTKHR
jgi:thiamine biosynthesis lipoprotein